MKNSILLLTVISCFIACEKSSDEPISIQNYLKGKVVHEIVSNPSNTKIFFVSSVIDRKFMEAHPFMCFIPSKFQLSCTDGNQVLYFEDLPYINSVAVDEQCNMYAAIYTKIVKFSPPHDSVTIKSCDNGFTALATDSAGRLWAGSSSEGVFLFENNIWKNFTTINSDLGGDQIIDIAACKNSSVWIASYGSSYTVSVTTGSTFTTYDLNELTGEENVTAHQIATDKNKNAWVSIYKNGGNSLIRVLEKRKTQYPVSLPNELNVIKLDNDYEGNVYLINRNGNSHEFYMYDGTEWVQDHYNLPSDSYIYDALQDASGNMWFGTNDGVIKKTPHYAFD